MTDRTIRVYCDAETGHAARHPEPVAFVFAPPPEGEEAWQPLIRTQRIRGRMGDAYGATTNLVGNERFNSARHRGMEVRNTVTIPCTARDCRQVVTLRGELLDAVLSGLDQMGVRRVPMRMLPELARRVASSPKRC